MFAGYQLRTTDRAAATTFYARVLAIPADEVAASVIELPERARAAGAPAHWLGYLAADDVAATTAALIDAGAQAIGPALRDPFGAVFALRAAPLPSPRVAWHLLHCTDHERAWAFYGPRFGWTRGETLELGGEHGACLMFTTPDGGAGGLASTALRPGIHNHWQFFFAVPDLDAALAHVRAGGGSALPPHPGPDGARVAACEDAQRAAFALWQA